MTLARTRADRRRGPVRGAAPGPVPRGGVRPAPSLAPAAPALQRDAGRRPDRRRGRREPAARGPGRAGGAVAVRRPHRPALVPACWPDGLARREGRPQPGVRHRRAGCDRSPVPGVARPPLVPRDAVGTEPKPGWPAPPHVPRLGAPRRQGCRAGVPASCPTIRRRRPVPTPPGARAAGRSSAVPAGPAPAAARRSGAAAPGLPAASATPPGRASGAVARRRRAVHHPDPDGPTPRHDPLDPACRYPCPTTPARCSRASPSGGQTGGGGRAGRRGGDPPGVGRGRRRSRRGPPPASRPRRHADHPVGAVSRSPPPQRGARFGRARVRRSGRRPGRRPGRADDPAGGDAATAAGSPPAWSPPRSPGAASVASRRTRGPAAAPRRHAGRGKAWAHPGAGWSGAPPRLGDARPAHALLRPVRTARSGPGVAPSAADPSAHIAR